MIQDRKDGYVFVAVSPPDGLTADALADIMKRRVEREGIDLGPVTELSRLAVQLELPGAAPADAERLAKAEDHLGEIADLAILPAQGRRKQLLVSDMDSTIIGQECIDELADMMGIKAEVAGITERAMRGELDFEDALRTRVALLAGLPLEALEACYHERIRFNRGAATLVATMAAHGARCLLVSGGFTAFTGRVARECGFHADQANQLIDDGRALTGKVREPILGRAAKRDALEEACAGLGIDLSLSLAIGDGANDLDMIRAAGLGIAYRAKPVVAAEAGAAINRTDLTTALYFQGYHRDEFTATPG